MKQFNLIAGLPRSGSTLLCQILSMNPDFYATPTSPISDMLLAQQSVYSHNPGFKAVDRLETYNDFAEAQKAFLFTYYKRHNVVFDKHRGWPMHLMKLDEILENEDTKIIWTYRDPIEVIASMEAQHRKLPLIQYTEEVQNPGVLGTMDARITSWISDNGIMIMPARALHEAVHTGYEDRIKIVEYSQLCKDPQGVMDSIHDFLGFPKYAYGKEDWKDLKQVTVEHDHLYNYKFPHIIKEGEIKLVEHDLDHLKTYKPIFDERFKWLVEYCHKEIVREAGKRIPRSKRMKINKNKK